MLSEMNIVVCLQTHYAWQHCGSTVGLSSTAFYIAADDWTRKNGKDSEWGIGKLFGAFRDDEEFVTSVLEISQTRCFYEIIRNNRPYKAYLDLEAEAGADRTRSENLI
jgi:hypothetical protein